MSYQNGARVTTTADFNNQIIWVIDNGFRRQVDFQTYSNLFVDMLGLIMDPNGTTLNTVPKGLPIPSTAYLASGTNTQQVFLVESNSVRRSCPGPVFTKWYFNPGKVQVVATDNLGAIPSAPDLF